MEEEVGNCKKVLKAPSIAERCRGIELRRLLNWVTEWVMISVPTTWNMVEENFW